MGPGAARGSDAGDGRRWRRWRAGALAVVVVAGAAACYPTYDTDADQIPDALVTTPSGVWRDLRKPTSAPPVWVGPTDIDRVAGDWDGNRRWDAAVVTSTGDWVTQKAGTFSFPKPDQLPAYDANDFRHVMDPVPADYDGDHVTDAAWYRDTDGTWFIRGQAPVVFGRGPTAPCVSMSGAPGCGSHGNDVIDQDYPVPADYDGDGKADLSTYNPRTMVWRVRSSKDGTISSVTMTGSPADLWQPAPADYDGVHHAQRALYGAYGWQIEGHTGLDAWGAPANLPPMSREVYPAVSDLDDDGRADLSYVASDGVWRTRSSTEPSKVTSFTVGVRGSGGSIPAAASSALGANTARLTLIARNCTPGQYNYPNDC